MFIITEIEYFTKWIKDDPLVSTMGPKIPNFIDTHIISRFGIPHKIISYNRLCFKNQNVQALCNGYNIQHSFSIPYYSYGNGQVEASNKTIVMILKKMVNDNYQNHQHEYLPYVLWTYQTSIRTPTRATPFSLVYGVEEVMLLKLDILSLGVQLQGLILDEDAKQS